jgi:hypothetical protein
MIATFRHDLRIFPTDLLIRVNAAGQTAVDSKRPPAGRFGRVHRRTSVRQPPYGRRTPLGHGGDVPPTGAALLGARSSTRVSGPRGGPQPADRCDPGGAPAFSRQRLSVDSQPAGPRSARRTPGPDPQPRITRAMRAGPTRLTIEDALAPPVRHRHATCPAKPAPDGFACPPLVSLRGTDPPVDYSLLPGGVGVCQEHGRLVGQPGALAMVVHLRTAIKGQ